MNTYAITYYRSPEGEEIGPQMVVEYFKCSTAKEAKKYARMQASRNDWRIIDICHDITK